MVDFLFGLLTGFVLTVLGIAMWNHFDNAGYMYLLFYVLPAGLYIARKVNAG